MNRREFFLLMIIGIVAIPTGYFRWYVPKICGARASATQTDVAALINELQSFHACIRSQAAFDLQKTGTSGEAAVPVLLKTSEDKYASVRWRSVAALGYTGSKKPEVKATLLRHLKDEDQTTVYNSIFSLQNFSSHEVTKGLIDVLDHPWNEIRYRAAQDLAKMFDKERDKDLLPQLVQKLEVLKASDPVQEVRRRASNTIEWVNRTNDSPTSQSQSTDKAMKSFTLNEFDALFNSPRISDGRIIQATTRAANRETDRSLKGQYLRLEAGIEALKQNANDSTADAFFCWVGDGMNTYKFSSPEFAEDFLQVESYMSKSTLQTECIKSAKATLEKRTTESSFRGLSFGCPSIW